MTIIPLQSSNPVIRCKCGGLGACRRDYHPAMSDHFQLLFVVIFIPAIPSQLGIPAFRYNPGGTCCPDYHSATSDFFNFRLWPFSFLPSSHNRSSPHFAVTAGGLGTCCRGHHLATSHQSHHSFFGLFMIIILPLLSNPLFRCKCQ